MRLAVLFACLALLMPTVTAAESVPVRPPLSTKRCPSGASSEAPPRRSLFLDESTSQTEAEKFLNTAIYCPNACYNLTATLTLKGGLFEKGGVQVDVDANHVCKSKTLAPNDAAQGQKRGCAGGEEQPQVVLKTVNVYSQVYGFKIPDQSIRKSRCNEDALHTSVAKFFDGLDKSGKKNPAGQSQMESALNDLRSAPDPKPNAPATDTAPNPDSASVAVPKPDTSTPVANSPEALAQALQERHNVPAEEALRVANENPDKLKELLEKSATNDTAGAQAIAKELKLNPDLFSSQANLEPPKQITTEEAKAAYEQQEAERNRTSTFADAQKNQTLPGGRFGQMYRDLEDKYGLKHGTLAMVAQREGNNPSACGVSNPARGISSSACGLFQHINSTWAIDSARINGGVPLPPSARLDPALSAEATAAAFAKYQNENRALMEGSGMDSRAALYAYHNLGTGSGPRFISAFARDPSMSVSSVLSPLEIRNNPSIYGNGSISLAQAQQNMIRDNGSQPRYAGLGGSVFGGITGGNYPTSVSFPTGGTNYNGGSPFSSANPFYYDSGYSTNYGYQPYTQSSPTNSIMSIFAGLFQGSSGSQSPNIQQIPTQNTPTQQQQQQQQAVVSIIAQPQQAYSGNHIVLSWSSVGMRNNPSCMTQLNTKSGTSTIATTNEGSKIVVAGSAGLMRFTISCTSLSGVSVTQATAVAVQ